ncbi:CaiB/BaiF CoA-transferase family protein [Aquimarina sp. RZ0]|uniref:CaiB/BaiF CoA transferase family protein n=1 Tax=Aquimarina sp. RZ0 TaxID=2607730 RepID=UPI0011F1CDB2|nr:CaiB/BaiF CoA-transferase family protein [Aquimarina sp. RZ0]KAA1246402.1 CoA transferase [Aquimarina sp. RZ0]
MLPLEGITVVEFAQFMAGPSAGLKLADLGARVIKIERPKVGESGRQIAIKNLFIDNDSLVFHTINRNKESFAANLKDTDDLDKIKKLLCQVDVMTHNFRPGVMEKIGLDYRSVKKMNSKIIYGDITGYGKKGPWAKKPGQDLLIQSLSGVTYLTGNKEDNPTPMGIAASDMFTGGHLAQGILAALYQRTKTGEGAMISVSLLESTLDMQFEGLTTYLNNDNQLPVRAYQGNAQPLLAAPYGIYKTFDSNIAISMVDLPVLLQAMDIETPSEFSEPDSWFENRDEIMKYLALVFIKKTTKHWLAIFDEKNIWSAPIYDYHTLLNHPGFTALKMIQEVKTLHGEVIKTTRCPFRIDGERIFSCKSAPTVGEDNEKINEEFNLN